MLANRFYYHLKPFIPWALRTALRRARASSRCDQYKHLWPIDPKAANRPANWPGWPQGKKFALVLTHDVEWQKGLDRVGDLMALEERHGFRSSFNFIPERDYRVSKSQLEDVRARGFEIGVHGLHHDGKLYSSKAEFARRAEKIRHYAEEWGATGFRSPLMQHKLGWLHDLEMDHDLSTFDTDPFEPEPDGFGTVFPFWVPGRNDSGYVELPYTLPQDFGLFIVLEQPNIDIWLKKLDWIVSQGGMVLLNTHPDYMYFGDGKPNRDEFPVALYEQFLTAVREKYKGQYWAALPSEVSSYYKEVMPPENRNSRKRVCMLAYTNYECDGRVRRYAETLARRGDLVHVIALGAENVPLGHEEISGVDVFRIQSRIGVEKSKWDYAVRLLAFLFRSNRWLRMNYRDFRYDVIHVHNVPDFLVFACWHARMSGTKIVLDIHDILPELFSNKFRVARENLYIKLLRWVERVSAQFADHVIISNDLWRPKYESRTRSQGKCSVYVNNVDPLVFTRRERTRTDDRFLIVFPGSFQRHQGLDIAIDAMVHLRKEMPNAELHLYGGGPVGHELEAQVQKLGLESCVKFCGSLTLDEIPQMMANADVGVVPKRADSFGNEAYSTKIMEFMSQGVPVVLSQTAIDSFYFSPSEVRFFPSGDSHALADAILAIAKDPRLAQQLSEAGLDYVERNGWESRRKSYLQLVDSLCVEVFRPISESSRLTANEPEPVATTREG